MLGAPLHIWSVNRDLPREECLKFRSVLNCHDRDADDFEVESWELATALPGCSRTSISVVRLSTNQEPSYQPWPKGRWLKRFLADLSDGVF